MNRIFSVLFLFITVVSYSQQADHRVARFDSMFTEAFQKDDFNGNVLIAENGQILYQKSFGKADWKTGRMLDDGSIFELASVSKQFTAMGIMLLVEESKLSLDDSLRKFFPELPYSNISVRQLLQHTSGLPDYMELFEKHWDNTQIASNAEMIALLAQHKPTSLFSPGEKWMYSNTGYALLASIIEKVSGKKFGEYLREKIFQPLGMERTLVYSKRYEKRHLENYAYGHVFDPVSATYRVSDDDPRFASMVYSLDGIQGDGCVNSTTGDLFKWHEALKTNQLVSAEMMKQAFTPAREASGPSSYGFGWGILNSKTYGKLVNHSGGWPGYSTFIERSLDNDRLIVILQNNGKKLFPVIKARMVLYGIEEDVIKEQPVTLDQMKDYVGVYELTPDFKITISIREGKLFSQATQQQAIEIFREKDDLFFPKAVEARLQFNRNAAKKVESLVLMQNGQEIPGKKIN